MIIIQQLLLSVLPLGRFGWFATDRKGRASQYIRAKQHVRLFMAGLDDSIRLNAHA